MTCFNLTVSRWLPSVAIAGLAGSMLIGVQPVKAETLLEDIGIGAAVGLGTGLFLGDDFGLDDAANGAAAGAACHIANEQLHNNRDERNLAEDLVVGAATSTATGLLTNDDSVLENAAQGAAACAVINVVD